MHINIFCQTVIKNNYWVVLSWILVVHIFKNCLHLRPAYNVILHAHGCDVCNPIMMYIALPANLQAQNMQEKQ